MGTLTVTLPSGAAIQHKGARADPEAVLVIRRWRALWRMMLAGDLGLARAYMDDDCRSHDIRGCLSSERKTKWRWPRPRPVRSLRCLERIGHFRRVNTRRGSRRNIAAHYDLGNEFYALWLDSGMNYSSALFTRSEQTLEQAQDAKLRRIVELLDLEPDQRILEIGCGWGPLVERLIECHGCHLTGLTLSPKQLDFAEARLGFRATAKNWDLRCRIIATSKAATIALFPSRCWRLSASATGRHTSKNYDYH